MNIDKAIKKQNKSLFRFVRLMCFIFLLLPICVICFNTFNLFIICYLVVIQIIIVYGVVYRIDKEHLKFQKENYKIVINDGLFSRKINFIFDNVVIVHVVKEKKDWKIVIILKSNYRDKRIKKVNYNFIFKYNDLEKQLEIIKKYHSCEEFSYFIVSKGLNKKYKLINIIYKNCVTASFTEEAILKIKECSK